MVSELKKESNIDNVDKMVRLIHIYYNHQGKDDEIKFDSFDHSDWNLKNCPEWTLEDIDKLNKFKDDFLMAMNKWISIIELKRGKANSLKCRKIYKRYQKRFAKVI